MIRKFWVITIILLAGTTNVVGQSRLDNVEQLMKQKRIGEAISVCRSYLQSSPRDENGWLFLAKCYQQIGNLDSCEIAAKKVIQLDDEMMEGYTVLTQVQLSKKDWQEAITTARAGLKMVKKKQPKYPPLLVVLGQSLLAVDSADAALVVAAEAKELDPKNAVAYEVMGDAYIKQRVAPMAINSYEKSLEVDSMQPNVLIKLARTYTKERQYTEAARTYNLLLAQQPNDNAARLELAQLFYRAKQWAKCAATLKDYFKDQKNLSKDVQLMYLEALYNSKQYNEAFQVALEYLKLDPNSPLANRAVSLGYIIDKQYAKAIDAYKKLATIDTMMFDDYRWLGSAYQKIKKDSLAAMTWEQALKDTSQSIMMRSYLLGEVGTIWMNLKSWERAAGFFEKRIQIDTTAVGSSVNLALCREQLEEFEKAISALKDAITRNPRYPPAYVHLGLCYFQMKDYDAGRKEFEKAIKIIDTAETKYRFELADANRMIAVAIMLEKRSTPEANQKRWEEASVYLKKSLKYKEDVAQTHLLLGQAYQNQNKKEDAIKEYKRTLQLDPKNKEAKNGLNVLQPE